MGKLEMRVSLRGQLDSSAWTEKHDVPQVKTQAEAEAYADACIEAFNANLRKFEQPRKLHWAKLVSEDSDAHVWQRTSFLHQTTRAGQMYDPMKCKNCGITARRYDLTALVLDAPYRKAAVYGSCSATQTHLKRLRIMFSYADSPEEERGKK